MTDYDCGRTYLDIERELEQCKDDVSCLEAELGKCRDERDEWERKSKNNGAAGLIAYERMTVLQSRLEQTLEKLAKYREALEFYADPAGWEGDKVPWGDTWVDLPNTNYVQYDGGETARKALGND